MPRPKRKRLRSQSETEKEREKFLLTEMRVSCTFYKSTTTHWLSVGWWKAGEPKELRYTRNYNHTQTQRSPRSQLATSNSAGDSISQAYRAIGLAVDKINSRGQIRGGSGSLADYISQNVAFFLPRKIIKRDITIGIYYKQFFFRVSKELWIEIIIN